MTNHMSKYGRYAGTDQSIMEVLRGSDKETNDLFKKVGGQKSEARQVVEDIMTSMGQSSAIGALETLADMGIVGSTLDGMYRTFFNSNPTELVDTLYDTEKMLRIRKDYEHERGDDWSTSGSEDQDFY